MKIIRVLIVLAVYAAACSPAGNPEGSGGETSAIPFSAEPAPEWSALFDRTEGWFGGDGIFAIPLSGRDFDDQADADSVLFVFSDTMVGKIDAGKLQPGYRMINNSIMVLKGRKPLMARADFRVNRNDAQEPTTLFVPRPGSAPDGDYFWLGDGFVSHDNGNLYLFAYRIRNTNTGDFPFREVGNSLLVLPKASLYPYSDHKQLELPFSDYDAPTFTSFGVGILDNTREAGVPEPDGYVYVYGVRGSNKQLVVARMSPDAVETFSDWEFWNGKGWSRNILESAALADSVSNELSVSPIGKNRYALVYQYGGIFPTICMQIGPTPVGPFGPRLTVWDTSDDLKADPSLFSYNAKAHPAISGPGELIISYNVNSFKFFEVIESIPNLYRPRFIRVKFHQD